MTKAVIPGEEGAELSRLYAEYEKAVRHGGAVLQKHGMTSPEFAAADSATNQLWRRIREILGDAGVPWNG